MRLPLALLLPLVCAACAAEPAGDAGSFPDEAFAAQVSESRHLSVEVRTAPAQPPTRGETAVELRVTDEEGEPVTGLSLDVRPWMPAMSHGSSTLPLVDERDDGVYVASRVQLFMSGSWELRTTISGPFEDHVVVAFEIP